MAIKHGGRGPGHLSRWLKAASSSIFPLDFTGSSLPAGASFTRAGSKSYTNAAGAISVFGTDAAALGTNGILIEPAGTNALPAPNLPASGLGYRSQDLENWSLSGGTATANQIAAPDGSTTADLWTATGSGAYGAFFYNANGHSLTGDITVSLYVKKGNCRYISVNHYGGANDYGATFDLDTTAYTGVPTGCVASTSRSITALANGWFRIVMSVASAVAGTDKVIVSTATGNNFTATVGDTAYFWGFQFEAGLVATSYIPQKSFLFYSEEIGTSPQIIENITITSNATTAPDGKTTADKMVEIAGLGNHEVFGPVGIEKNKDYIFWGYFKQAERRYAYTRLLFNGGNQSAIVIDLQTGSITQTDVRGTTTAPVAATVTDAGNGWWLWTLTANDSSVEANAFGIGTTNTATPDLSTLSSSHYDSEAVGSGIYVWGLVVEKGTARTPYYRTRADGKSRAVDALSFTIPAGVSTLRYTFDDNSTQDVSVSPGAYTVPTNLNRPYIKTIAAV